MIMKQSINVNGAPAAVVHMYTPVKTGNMIFISGQLGFKPGRWYPFRKASGWTVQSLENLENYSEGTGLILIML